MRARCSRRQTKLARASGLTSHARGAYLPNGLANSNQVCNRRSESKVMSNESTSQRSRCLVRLYSQIVFVALTTVGWAVLSICAENPAHHGSTPSRWHVGSTWAVSVFAADHQLVGSMVIRLTGETASSCIAGDWQQAEILKRQFRDSDFLATKPLSYSIQGNKLTLGVTEVCDGYVFLRGVLTDKGATGDYGTFGKAGFTRLGSFTAATARD